MDCLAVIPARGGSKGIPGKNLLRLAGKPLVAHSIEQALSSGYITRVIVSTDDSEIAKVSRQYGAEVVMRPVEISGDLASSESALIHVLESLYQSEGYQPEMLVFLQCTSPLTQAEDIDGTIGALLEEDADTAFAATPFHYFLWRNEEGDQGSQNAVGINHDKNVRPLRQEREPQYIETGAVYAMRVPGFLETKHRFFGQSTMHIMPHERRLEIDEAVDFKIAEVLLSDEQKSEDQFENLPNPIQALVLDFDGVFTDNHVVVLQDGQEAVLCDRSDGWGIAQLRKTGLPMLILSTETNPVVQARADKLGLPCIHGLDDKWQTLKSWLVEQEMDPMQVVYVGNDMNDFSCMSNIGCSVAVADAHPQILAMADIVLKNQGGHGAVREISDAIIKRVQ